LRNGHFWAHLAPFRKREPRWTIAAMSRTTETFTISLPPEMAAELERVRKGEHRTRSELIREALCLYFRHIETEV
jgi:Ribbon-helix-helix protein, copG family